MKTLKNAIKIGVAACALALSGMGHAATLSSAGTTNLFNVGLKAYGETMALTTVQWQIDDGGTIYQVFCIEPSVRAFPATASYAAESIPTAQMNTDILKLYASSYSTNFNAEQSSSFQLALWEMTDNKNLTTGVLQVPTLNGTPITNAVATGAAKMIVDAGLYTGSLNGYNFIKYNSVTSQDMLAVTSAVPEADTWAMMGVGLGLIGLMGRRRKSAQTEKFA